MAMLLESAPRAAQRLEDSSQHELRRLRVVETDSSVILEGRVTSYYLKQLAQELVRPAADGRRVVNRVFVVNRGEMVVGS
jgi:hypothetical protein